MSPTNTDTYTYNAANQLISRDGSSTGWTYDANGTETSAVVFGDKDRTNTVNAKDQYTNFTVGASSLATAYLGAGHDERTKFGATTFTTSPTGLAHANNNGNIANYVRDPDGTPIAMRYASESYYFAFDALGSVVALINDTGVKTNSYSYDPYGISRTKTENVPNNLEFTGGHYDSPTGLYKLGIRYYDPTLGRFTQPEQDPHYTYARNSPCNYTDPSGAVTIGQACGIGAVVGAVGGVIGTVGIFLAALSPLAGGLTFGTAVAVIASVNLGVVGGCATGAIGEYARRRLT